jgi:hypothetical protein
MARMARRHPKKIPHCSLRARFSHAMPGSVPGFGVLLQQVSTALSTNVGEISRSVAEAEKRTAPGLVGRGAVGFCRAG